MKKRGLKYPLGVYTLRGYFKKENQKMKNNQKYLVIFVGMIALALPGCRFRREISVSMPAESEEQIQVESNTNIEKEDGRNYLESVKLKRNDNTDLNQFAQLLLGVPTIEEAEQYKPKHFLGDYYYEKDGTVVIYNKDFAISYSDENDGMASTYSHLMNPIGDGSLLRETYPEESLASCTKEQAVKACEKYARLCGYEDAEVSSYAITLDAIQNIEKKLQYTIGAPGEGYEVITRGQVEQLRDEGKEAEADALYDKMDSGFKRNLPWKKEYEAMLLVYKLKLNGVLMDNEQLEIIYLPYQNKVVILSADLPYEPEEISEKHELVSKEKAMSQAIQTLGTNITIDTISLVYVKEYNADGENYAVPTWRVDYIQNNESAIAGRTGTIYIDAVSGFVVNN